MSFKVLFSFAVIYIVWGSTFTAIKFGLESFPPFILAAMRFGLAGFAFLIFSRGKGLKEMKPSEYSREALIGVLLTSANAGVCWSEQYISSGIASLIVGLIPVIFVLFNWMSFEKKAPHIAAITGLSVGLFGVVLISSDNANGDSWAVIGGLILANCLWAVGSLLFRATPSKHDYFTRASVQLISGSSFLVVLSFLIGERAVDWTNIGANGILSVTYLALAGTILAYTCYSYLLKNVRTELTSTYALVNPIVAIFFGVLWFNEPFTNKIIISSLLILISVALVIYGQNVYQFVFTKKKST